MIVNPERVRWFLARGLLAGVLSAALVGPTLAQETEGPLSPAGRLRLEVAPVFLSWSSRLGPSGAEPLGAELTDPSGAGLFPGIVDLESRLREFLGDAGWAAHLGTSAAHVSRSRVRVPLRVDVGVLEWLTVGVTVPLVQNRTEVSYSFRADSATANLGVNPAVLLAPDVIAFTDELRERALTAATRATELCGQAPASPECAAATELGLEGDRLLEGFLSTYAASPFFPLATSAAAQALQQRVGSFNEGLAALTLPPLSREPLFASARVGGADLQGLLSDAAVGVNTGPLDSRAELWELGDVELHAALRLLEGAVLDATAGTPRLAYQVGAGVLVRLGTGSAADPDIPLDLGSGDGQTDLEGRVFSNLRSGRFGLWGDARYGVQRPRTLTRRVGPPELALVPAINRATVEWTPGTYFQLELSPRYHFTEELAFTGGYRLFRKAEDEFVRVSAPPDPPDLSPLPSPPVFTDVTLLAHGTEETLHELGGGLVLSTLSAWQEGRARLPLEARLGVRWVVGGEGRQVPAGVRATVGLRIYRRLWGS